MFRFGNMMALQLLWLVPVLAVIFYVASRRSLARVNKGIGPKLAPFLLASYSPKRRKFKFFLQLLSLTFFVLALAQPQTNKGTTAVKSEGVELIIAVDVSNSMLAEDVKPSRLAYAKSELLRLLDLLGGDKVGLIAFAGSALVLSPITSDKSALKMYVEGLSPQSIQSQGTVISKALQEAREAFERGGADNDEQSRVTRVILVISDGEDHEQGALDEAQKLVKEGTRVFAVAFGTERGAPIPVRDERGFLKGYKKDKAGQNVMTAVKGDFLRELASVGKGSFYHSSFGGGEAKKIHAEIDKLEKTQFDSEVSASYDEKYQIPLVIGILIALLEMMIGERKKQGRLWKGRFEVSNQ